jgi:hypothetical protein
VVFGLLFLVWLGLVLVVWLVVLALLFCSCCLVLLMAYYCS